MLCVKKHSHAQWRDFKMNVLICDDDQQIVDGCFDQFGLHNHRFSLRMSVFRRFCFAPLEES